MQQEEELWHTIFRVVKITMLYSDPTRNQYKIFWIRFPKEVFQWLDHLQEAPKYKHPVKNKYNWIVKGLMTLHHLDHPISHAVEFWGKTILEGYIIEFFAENHHSFSKVEGILK